MNQNYIQDLGRCLKTELQRENFLLGSSPPSLLHDPRPQEACLSCLGPSSVVQSMQFSLCLSLPF